MVDNMESKTTPKLGGFQIFFEKIFTPILTWGLMMIQFDLRIAYFSKGLGF